MDTVQDDSTVTAGPLVDSLHPTLPRWMRGPKRVQLRAPDAVGRYDVGEILGKGGGGTVFAGRDEALGRDVAIKFVQCGTGSAAATRVLKEARALARLSHPNIVQIYDYGRLEDTLYFVMEFVPGATLRGWLESGPPSTRVLEMFLEIGRGLAAAHAAGVVHRDFKPSNVIVGTGGPRILDFGLAQLSAEREDRSITTGESQTDPDKTREGAVKGTPKFMSPEQWGGGGVDARTDQFSYCLCLFVALYGQPPFSTEALMLASADHPLPALDLPKSSSVPGALRRALARGLQREPADRWSTMPDLLNALTRAIPRRRRAVWAVGAVAVLGAVGWGVRSPPAAACTSLGEAVPELGDTQRAQLDAAFLATAVPYAQQASIFAQRELEEFVAQWRDVAEETCIAGVRQTLTRGALDHRRACLDHQYRRFNLTTQILAEVTSEGIAGSADVASSLPTPTDCRTQREETSDGATASAVDRADLLRRAARLPEALAVVETALSQDPEASELMLARGRIHEGLGEFSEAAAVLRSAYGGAEARGRDEVAASAAIDLVRVLGYRMSHADQAAAFEVTAAAKIERVVPEFHVMRSQLAAAQGRFALGRGDPESALAAFQRSIAMRGALGREGLGLAADLNKQAQALNMLGRYDESRAALGTALEIRMHALGPAHPLVGSNRLNLGNAAADLGDQQAATTHYAAAVKILEASLGRTHPQTAGAYASLASSYAAVGRDAEAEALWRAALAAYDHAQVVRVAAEVRGSLGLFLHRRGRDEASVDVLRRAHDDLVQALQPGHGLLANARSNLALVLHAQGEFAESLTLIEAAIETYVQIHGHDSADAFTGRQIAAMALEGLDRDADVVAMYSRVFEVIGEDAMRPYMVDALVRQASAAHDLGRDDVSAQALGRARALARRYEQHEALTAIDGFLEELGGARTETTEVSDRG